MMGWLFLILLVLGVGLMAYGFKTEKANKEAFLFYGIVCFIVSLPIFLWSTVRITDVAIFIYSNIFLISGFIKLSSLFVYEDTLKEKEVNIVRVAVVVSVLLIIGFILLWNSSRFEIFPQFLGWMLLVMLIVSLIHTVIVRPANVIEDIKNEIHSGIHSFIDTMHLIIYAVFAVGVITLIGLVVYLYINVYDPLANNEWKPMSLFSYPEWFIVLSDEEQEALIKEGKDSIISGYALPLWLVKFEVREILKTSDLAWTYKKNDKAIFYIVWHDPHEHTYHFAKVSRYWLDNSKVRKRERKEKHK